MTARSSDDAAKVYQYLADHFSAKRYTPTISQIATAMGWCVTEPHRTMSALTNLTLDGAIQFTRTPKGSRAAIRLTDLSPRVTAPTAQKQRVAPASPKPGQIICVQYRNPVCAESKYLCARHLELAREAVTRCNRKRGVKPWRPGGRGRPPKVMVLAG